MLVKNKKYRVVFLIDMNSYFASVAAILDPTLKDKVFVVGRANNINGIVTSPSYAARRLGIKAGMPQSEAIRIYPKLIIVQPEYSEYSKYQEKFVEYVKKFTPVIQVASIDELYADMTVACQYNHPLELAKKIQDGLLNDIGLPCSIGIGPTLFLAKMASEFKKPLGISILRKRDVKAKLYHLDIENMYGVGRKTYSRLKEKGIITIGDLVNPNNEKTVIKVMSKNMYNQCIEYLSGKSSNVVDPHKYAVSEAISISRTFDVPVDLEIELQKKLEEFVDIIIEKLRNENLIGKTITLTLKDTSYKTIHRSKTIPDYTDDKELMLHILLDLLDDNFINKSYRLIGCGISNLVKKDKVPLDYNLFTYEKYIRKHEIVDETIKKINKAYKKEVITKGIKKE